MDPSLVALAVTFAAGVTFLAVLTAHRRGPFAFALARLNADRRAYAHVTASLCGVVLGLIALPLVAWRWPSETSAWAAPAFIALAMLANAVQPMFRKGAS